MKKLIIIALLASLIIGCKKKSSAPTPAAPINNTNSMTLNSQEQQLVGYWIMDSMIVWINNQRLPISPGYSSVYTNSLTCKLELKSNWYQNNSGFNSYEAVDGHQSCSLIPNSWKAPDPGFLNLGGILLPIITLNSNQLAFSNGDMSNGLRKYYFHK